MTISIQYNGIELTNYLDAVINITRNVGQNRTPSLVKIGHTDGQRFQYTTASEGTITITAIIRNQKTERRRLLAQALMQSEPAKLIFSDEPGLYYLAITTGQQTLAEQFLHNTLTLAFIVPDGIAHSVDTKTADNTPYKDVPVNMLIDSGFESGKTPSGIVWGTSDDDVKLAEVDPAIPSHPTPLGTYMLRIENQSSDSSSSSDKYIVFPLAKPVTIKAGETWTYSYKYASAGSATGQASDYLTTSDLSPIWGLSMGHGNRDTDGGQDTWHQFSATMTADSDITVTNYRFGFVKTYAGGGWICIDNIKLEKNDAASPWSPNPADPEYYSDTITVHNGGTYPVYPVIEATMHSDNGVVTLINENNGGIIQLGNPGEVDGVQAPPSETVFHYDLMSAPSGVAVNTGKINYPTYPYGSNPVPNTIAGSWDYALNKDAATPVLNRTAAMRWAGPTFHGPIKANAAGVNTGNLIWSNRFNVTTSVGALGRVEFNLQSGDNIAVCFVMRDSTYAADMLTVEGWVNGHNVFAQDLNRKLFTNGFYEIVESKLGNTTTFKLTKIKQLSAYGVISSAQTVFPPVTIDGVADTPIDSFTVWMSGFSNTTGWTINWSDSVFQWVNVDYWKDLPNRFSNGDTLLVDPSQIKVFVNNVEDRTLHAIDNDWEKFRLDPGDTNIKIITSDFASAPTVVATYREAFM